MTISTAKSGLEVTLAQMSFGDCLVSNNAIAATRQIMMNTKETMTAREP